MPRKTDAKWDDYKAEFTKNNYDRLTLLLPKGEREVIRAHIAGTGESVNSFINRAIGDLLKREGAGGPANEKGVDDDAAKD